MSLKETLGTEFVIVGVALKLNSFVVVLRGPALGSFLDLLNIRIFLYARDLSHGPSFRVLKMVGTVYFN